MLAPRIVFPVPTEYVQVRERKKINFQRTFFHHSVSHKVVTLSPYCSYIYIYVYVKNAGVNNAAQTRSTVSAHKVNLYWGQC